MLLAAKADSDMRIRHTATRCWTALVACAEGFSSADWDAANAAPRAVELRYVHSIFDASASLIMVAKAVILK